MHVEHGHGIILSRKEEKKKVCRAKPVGQGDPIICWCPYYQKFSVLGAFHCRVCESVIYGLVMCGWSISLNFFDLLLSTTIIP